METCVSNYQRLLANNIVLTDISNSLYCVRGKLLKKKDYGFGNILIFYSFNNWKTPYYCKALETRSEHGGFVVYRFDIKWAKAKRHMTFLIGHTFEGRMHIDDNGGEFYKLRRNRCQFEDIVQRYRVQAEGCVEKDSVDKILEAARSEDDISTNGSSVVDEPAGERERSDGMEILDFEMLNMPFAPSKKRKMDKLVDVDWVYDVDNDCLMASTIGYKCQYDEVDDGLGSSVSESNCETDSSSISTYDSDRVTCSIATDELSMESLDDYIEYNQPMSKSRYYFAMSTLPKKGQQYLQDCLDYNGPPQELITSEVCKNDEGLQNSHPIEDNLQYYLDNPDFLSEQKDIVSFYEKAREPTDNFHDEETFQKYIERPDVLEEQIAIISYFNGDCHSFQKAGEHDDVLYQPLSTEQVSEKASTSGVCIDKIQDEHDENDGLTPHQRGVKHERRAVVEYFLSAILNRVCEDEECSTPGQTDSCESLSPPEERKSQIDHDQEAYSFKPASNLKLEEADSEPLTFTDGGDTNKSGNTKTRKTWQNDILNRVYDESEVWLDDMLSSVNESEASAASPKTLKNEMNETCGFVNELGKSDGVSPWSEISMHDEGLISAIDEVDVIKCTGQDSAYEVASTVLEDIVNETCRLVDQPFTACGMPFASDTLSDFKLEKVTPLSLFMHEEDTSASGDTEAAKHHQHHILSHPGQSKASDKKMKNEANEIVAKVLSDIVNEACGLSNQFGKSPRSNISMHDVELIPDEVHIAECTAQSEDIMHETRQLVDSSKTVCGIVSVSDTASNLKPEIITDSDLLIFMHGEDTNALRDTEATQHRQDEVSRVSGTNSTMMLENKASEIVTAVLSDILNEAYELVSQPNGIAPESDISILDEGLLLNEVDIVEDTAHDDAFEVAAAVLDDILNEVYRLEKQPFRTCSIVTLSETTMQTDSSSISEIDPVENTDTRMKYQAKAVIGTILSESIYEACQSCSEFINIVSRSDTPKSQCEPSKIDHVDGLNNSSTIDKLSCTTILSTTTGAPIEDTLPKGFKDIAMAVPAVTILNDEDANWEATRQKRRKTKLSKLNKIFHCITIPFRNFRKCFR